MMLAIAEQTTYLLMVIILLQRCMFSCSCYYQCYSMLCFGKLSCTTLLHGYF